MPIIKFEDIGIIKYRKSIDYQLKKLDQVVGYRNFKDREQTNYLIFCEHPNVYTLGKSGADNNLLINEQFLKSIKAEFHKTDRGGDITFHGPGQLVAYPIFDLKVLNIGIKSFVYKIEESIIKTLSAFGIIAKRLPGATGVWIDVNNPAKTRKICAIGVRVKNLVSMHGLACNINNDLSYFNHINPCGFTDKSVTSLKQELGNAVDMDLFKKTLLQHFSDVFELRIITETDE